MVLSGATKHPRNFQTALTVSKRKTMGKRGGRMPGAGRPKGSKSKTGEAVRAFFLQLMERNMEQLEADLAELDPYQRWRIVVDLAGKVLPANSKVELNNVPFNLTIYTDPETPMPKIEE